MGSLLAGKKAYVEPAKDAVQRGADASEAAKDAKPASAKDAIVNLSFKVPAEFRKQFKRAAIDADITQNELVVRALEVWVAAKR